MSSGDEAEVKEKKWRSADVKTVENVEFRSLLLSDRILEGLKNCGFEKPSPVQLQAIPLGRCGIDLIVQAKSGTGKTCVLGVIALDNLMEQSPNTQVLIMSPTREIATQVCGVVRSLGCSFSDLTCESFIGGLPLSNDKTKLPKCQIIVGTPGRIKQLIDMEHIQTDSIRLFVLDEADKLFEKQFKEDINWIFSSLPSRKQILALSATFPEELSKFLALYMENPVYVRINSKDPALLGVTQYFHSVPFHPMLQVTDSAKFDVLLDILNTVTFSQCMIFCQRQSKAQDLADNLVLKGFPALGICAALNQVRRLEIMSELKSFRCRVLVSTDLTARGIDAENVNLVINFDIPFEGEVYLHRIGRAGRYGTRGMSISLASTGDEINRLKAFQKKFFFKIYQLPDPIPSDLWEVTVALQALLPQEPDDKDISTESIGRVKTNSLNYSVAQENSLQEDKPNQVLTVNSTIQDKLGENVSDTVTCLNGSVEVNGIAVTSGTNKKCSHSASEKIVSEVTVSNTGKVYETGNLESSISEYQVKAEKQSKCQPTSQDELNTALPTDTTKDISDELNTELPTDTTKEISDELNTALPTDTTKDISEVDKAVGQESEQSSVHISRGNKEAASSSEVVVNMNSAAECESPSDTVSLDVTEDLNTGNQNQGKNNSTAEPSVSDSIRPKDPESIGLNTESEPDSKDTVMPGSEAIYLKAIEHLFQNWETPFPGTENSELSEKEISNIIVPLITKNKAECFDFSYIKLVESLKSYSGETVQSVGKPFSEMSFSGYTHPSEHLEILHKYIYHNKREFLTFMQTAFNKLEKDNMPSKSGEIISENVKDSCANNSSSSVQPNSLLNDNPVPEAADGFQSRSATSDESLVDPNQDGSELLENIHVPDSKMKADSQNQNEIKSPQRENKDIECAKANSFGDSSTVAAEANSTSNNHISSSGEKSGQPVKEDPLAYQNNVAFNRNVYNITEDDYRSITCGTKHYKIIPLPSELSDLPKKSSLVHVKNNNSGRSPSQKPQMKNQSGRKKRGNKVRGTSQKGKKQEFHETELNSVEIPPSEQGISERNELTEECVLASSVAAREREPKSIPENNAAPVHAFVHFKTAESKKKGKSLKNKYVNNLENLHESGNNACNMNPVNYNDTSDDLTHAGMYKASGYSQPRPNRVKQVSSHGSCTRSATCAPNHGTSSCSVNSHPCTSSYNCCCRPSYALQIPPCASVQYNCCCRPSYYGQNRRRLQLPVPSHSSGPQNYYRKYLEMYYYIQNLTYGHLH